MVSPTSVHFLVDTSDNGILIKKGIEDAANELQEIGERLPSLIEGFMSAFDENGNG